VLDTAPIPWSAEHGIAVSADGERLYLGGSSKIAVIERETRSLITELPYRSEDCVGISPDNRMVAVAAGGLHLLSTDDYHVMFEDTEPVLHCEFSSDSRTLYCARKGTDLVYQVDLTDPAYPVTLTSTGNGWVYFVIPTPDESKLLLYKNMGSGVFAFEVFEKASDSIIFRDIFTPGYGTLAMTPDGRYAFYTSPGSIFMESPPLLGFKVFDIRANAIDTVIEDPDFFREISDDGQGFWMAPPALLAVSPDSRWLGIIGGVQTVYFAAYLYNIQNKGLFFRVVPGDGPISCFANTATQNAR
jgi:hypothetical protein